MTENHIHLKSDSTSNTLKASNKIKLNVYRGMLGGNIIPPGDPCKTDNSLNFSCPENSQYIPLI